MAEKMGASLAQSGRYEVTVIGYSSTGTAPESLKQVSLGKFSRLSPARWWARWKAFRLALSIRPDVFIFGTYELIFPAFWLKVILGTRIIYDVRENYYRNIFNSEGLTWLIRLPLALIVRLIEKLSAPSIDHFFLAERGYDKEFRFHRGGWTVLENKALNRPHSTRQPAGNAIHLLFSGTLSESAGVFRAIHLAEALHQTNMSILLTIAGYAASHAVRNRLLRDAGKRSFIKCIGIDRLVSHKEINDLIDQSDAGIIAYTLSPHTLNTVPTKLFEYLEASLPILTESHWPWVEQYASCEPFVLVNFENPDVKTILNILANRPLYTKSIPDASWSSEEAKLLEAIKNVV